MTEKRTGELPASGAWREEFGAGERKFFKLPEGPFALEGGGHLIDPVLAYETYGSLNGDCSNAVLVFHALSGDAHVCGSTNPPSQPTGGWWDDFVGAGKPIDTDECFVVCANVLGGCQGSTGPSSVDPATGERYGAAFPVVTVRDVVRSQRALGLHLGVDRWLCVIGGSLGGMAALEWAVMYPQKTRSLVVIAASAAASAQQIAWSKVGRQAILDDPKFNGGQYYGAVNGDGPHLGLANARRIAMVHYRSDEEFNRRFARRGDGDINGPQGDRLFDVERYLDHHGEEFVRRFDANSYLVLNKMMDLHDIGRGRGGVKPALQRICVPTMAMSIRTDFLCPGHHLMEIAWSVESWSRHVEVDSNKGHDGFLAEPNRAGEPIASFIEHVRQGVLD